MFRFRLQQVLDLREKSERALALQLVQALNAEQAAKDELRELQSARFSNAAQASESGNMRSVGELANLAFVIQKLDNHIVEAGDLVQTSSAAVSQVQQDLTTAHQGRRVLDRLKERQSDFHKTAAEQRDRHTMDELAISRHVQRSVR